MTEKEFTEISLTIGLTFGISYMLFIVYKLAEESKAGHYGMILPVILRKAYFKKIIMIVNF
jgi:hypothetical protein